MVDRVVPDGWSSDEVTGAPAEVEPEDVGLVVKRGPVTPYNKGIRASLNDVGRGIDNKLHGHDGSGRWYTLEHEGDPDLEFWSACSTGAPAGPVVLTADDWAFANKGSRDRARKMDSLAVEDGQLIGRCLRDGMWNETFVLLDAGDIGRERWVCILSDAIPAIPTVTDPFEASTTGPLVPLPASGWIGGVPIATTGTPAPPPHWTSHPLVPVATTTATSSGTVHLGPGTISVAPLATKVPDGTTSEKPTQINFRSDTETKRRLRLAAAKADMKVGEYVEHLLKMALAETEATEAECAGAEVMTFGFEVVVTPAAEKNIATMDLLRNVFRARGFLVVECHANKSERDRSITGAPSWDPSITAPVV